MFKKKIINEIEMPDLPDGMVWRAVSDFDVALLPWEKYADSWIGRFRKFNINTEGTQQYPKGRAVVIHTKGDFWISNYYDSNSIMPKGDKHFTTYYSHKEWDLLNKWRKKFIYMAIEKGLVKMDSMNNEDMVSMKYTEINNAVSNKNKLSINGIEILEWNNLKFDFDRGYLEVTGFNDEGVKENMLIRDILKANVKIS
jgi:hypothetical protein